MRIKFGCNKFSREHIDGYELLYSLSINAMHWLTFFYIYVIDNLLNNTDEFSTYGDRWVICVNYIWSRKEDSIKFPLYWCWYNQCFISMQILVAQLRKLLHLHIYRTPLHTPILYSSHWQLVQSSHWIRKLFSCLLYLYSQLIYMSTLGIAVSLSELCTQTG